MAGDLYADLTRHLALHGALTRPEVQAVCGAEHALNAGVITVQETIIGPLAFPGRLADAPGYIRSPSAATNSAYLRLAMARYALDVRMSDPKSLGRFKPPLLMPVATYAAKRVVVGGKVFGDGVSTRNLTRYFKDFSLSLREHRLALLLISPETAQYEKLDTRGSALLLLRYSLEQALEDNQ